MGFVMQNVQQIYIHLILSKIPGPVRSVVLKKKPDTTPLNHLGMINTHPNNNSFNEIKQIENIQVITALVVLYRS